MRRSLCPRPLFRRSSPDISPIIRRSRGRDKEPIVTLMLVNLSARSAP
jgi:hypothetical protein